MSESNIVNLDLQNFQQVLLEGSKEKLIIIDFWADWCEPCKQLMPVLEKLAIQYSDQIILAKINCDEQQELAAQFGIRSLPTVAFFKDGQPVDSFGGVKTEGEIREILTKHLPSPSDDLIQQAHVAMGEGDTNTAYTLAKQAYDLDNTNMQALKLLAEAAVDAGRLDQAKELVAKIPLVEQDSDYQRIKGKLELAEDAADSPELRALQEQVENNPDDLALKLQLALKFHEANRDEEALQQVFIVLGRDVNFADAKKYALDIINSLPDGDPLAATYRRKLYSTMY
ncbi:thioredoxin [Idiomarina sp. M1R2S28]|uniref:Thioredoxin n=1 Tax=Idiomarina rhizosphaerae TaxID=2961572 RepID=A0A9X2FTU1_9GAMM|nr:thioredoxin [Idiomarina rhizosphaerae]MCP1339172.1 thioredoxin [Idiomarina rhizosphaerae]